MAGIGRLKVTLFVALVLPAALSAQDAAPLSKAPDGRRESQVIIWPGPRVSPGFRLTVQKAPRFPNGQAGERSIPSESRGLEVSLQPEKAQFSDRGPLAFRLTYRNTSDKAFLLDRPDRLGASARLVIANQATAAQWTLTSDFPKGRGNALIRLEPGASLRYTLVVSSRPAFIPQPRPPRPTPIDPRVGQSDSTAAGTTEAEQSGKTPGSKVPRQPSTQSKSRIRPPVVVPRPRPRPVPPIVISPQLPCGAGQCRTMLLLEFKGNTAVKNGGPPLWVGKIATRPVDVTIAGGRPVIIQPRPRVESTPLFRKSVGREQSEE
ncbi:MAG: hypothetical protein CMJ48_01635 [Planctomycetaceae bacterium]|nr:hypothetical protein [Planctomycetaceae bacterium]